MELWINKTLAAATTEKPLQHLSAKSPTRVLRLSFMTSWLDQNHFMSADAESCSLCRKACPQIDSRRKVRLVPISRKLPVLNDSYSTSTFFSATGWRTSNMANVSFTPISRTRFEPSFRCASTVLASRTERFWVKAASAATNVLSQTPFACLAF